MPDIIDPDLSPPRCSICRGPIAQSTVGSGFDPVGSGHPVWVHTDLVDWARDPHDAVPLGEKK